MSSRESAKFRDGIVKIAATKVSAGVSTGVGDHESKYSEQANNNSGKEAAGTAKQTAGTETDKQQTEAAQNAGDEQFEINDDRSFETMYKDIAGEGLQPVLNDYIYV